jgi:hypothetical protein
MYMDKVQRQVMKIEKRMDELHLELGDFGNVTRARRIRINILLDGLANQLRKLRNV